MAGALHQPAGMETTTTRAPDTRPVTGCCPPFDPARWQDNEIRWRDKLFVKQHVRTLFHIPLGMGHTVTRAMAKIDAAGAAPAEPLMLSDDASLWGSDLYIAVTKEVPGAEMAKMSGTFFARVFEGPYRDAGKWAASMTRHVAAQGRRLEKLYLGYTTCPACAKAYGKNYVIVLAKLAE